MSTAQEASKAHACLDSTQQTGICPFGYLSKRLAPHPAPLFALMLLCLHAELSRSENLRSHFLLLVKLRRRTGLCSGLCCWKGEEALANPALQPSRPSQRGPASGSAPGPRHQTEREGQLHFEREFWQRSACYSYHTSAVKLSRKTLVLWKKGWRLGCISSGQRYLWHSQQLCTTFLVQGL